MPSYYGTPTTVAKEATSNTVIANDADASYSVQLTTGTKDKLIIDICGSSSSAALSDASCIRIRCIVNDGELTGYNKITTPAFQYGDVSSVVGDIGLTSDNEGRVIAGMEKLPFTFRTIEQTNLFGNTNNRSIRVVVKAPGIKNGDKVSVLIDASNNGNKANWVSSGFDNTGADIRVNQAGNTPPRVLINAGPSGTGNDAGIPNFSARLLKKAGSSTDATLEISSGNKSLFSSGGEGIGLKTLSFSLSKQNIDGNPGGNDIYFSLTNANEKVVDGVYLYEYTVTDGVSNAYYLQCRDVADDFDKSEDVNQFPVPNELLLVSNQPVQPNSNGTNITVDGDDELGAGNKAVVSFKGAGAPEGYNTIERYSAYYASRDQIEDMPRKSVNVADFKAHVSSQVAHIYRDDISYAAQDSVQKIPITQYLSNTILNDNGTRYSVLVTASTKDKSGAYIESSNTTDLSFTSISTSVNDASMGFRVSGTPDAAVNVSVKTGKAILTATETTNNDTMFNKLDNNLDVIYFDNVDQNGRNYDSLRYAVVRASDVKYVGSKDFTLDGSFTTATGTFSGTSDSQTLTIDATDSKGVAYIYSNNKWIATPNAGLKDASNGSQFALKFAFKNGNGVGAKSDWVYFTPSATPNAKDAIFAFDPSGDDKTAHFGNFTSGNADFELDQADITSNALATAQGLAVGATGIEFKWSLKNKTEKAKGAAGAVNESLDGGSEITASRYTVDTASTLGDESNTMRNARIHGQPQANIDSTKSSAFAQYGTPERIFASVGKDNKDNTVSMKMGQRYDIEGSLVNANGFNTDQAFKCVGFAPMGTLVPPRNVRQGTAVPVLDSNFKARVDISLDDLSGTELGGHLLTAYDVKMTQNVNGVIKTLRDFTTTSSNKALDGSNNGIINNTKTLGRQILVTSTNVATAGFPITVTLRAEANAKALVTEDDGGANNGTKLNKAESINQSYNKNRANVQSETVITVAGPSMASGSEHDEVQGLNVTTADKALTIEFATPQNGAVKDGNKDNGNDPRILYYKVTTWDISQTTIASNNSDVLAVNKYEKTINYDADKSTYAFTQDGLVNGCAYLVQVQTQWGYGPAYTEPFTTVGMYSTTPNKGSITDVPKAVSGGYRWYSAGANANNLTNPIKALTTAPSGNGSELKMHLPVGNSNYHVPSTKPTIINDRANKVLKIRDNGNALNNGALIQIAPNATGSGKSMFHVDLLVESGGTPTNYTSAPAFKDNIDLTYTIKDTTLGANWAKERNIIIVENDNGATWEVQQEVPN